MPKIVKNSIKFFERSPTLKIFKYDNSKKFYCSFYVGKQHTRNGNKEQSLKTENRQNAEKLAKEVFRKFWEEHKDTPVQTRTIKRSFDLDIAQPYLKTRIEKYEVKGNLINTGQKEKSQYERFMKSYFENVDYTIHDHLFNAVKDIIENLKRQNFKDTTISKYMNTISLMLRKAFNSRLIQQLPDLKEIITLRRINEQRPSYLNNELNMITKRLQEEFNTTKDSFFLEMKDYINLIRSAGFRPGIEPLKIKRFQYKFIHDKNNPTEPILFFTLHGTKTKPKHQLSCHPFFTKHIFIPEIQKRNPDAKQDDYLLFPKFENRQRLYERIRKNFTRISSELGLYVRNGLTRPLYSIRHTFIKQRFDQNVPLQVVARHSNTSVDIINKNYLDDSEEMIVSEHKKLFGSTKSKLKNKIK
jgi:hypothetical protein